MLSTTSLYEIHLCILILSLLHVHSCTMEDNPLLVDMCLVVMFFSLLTPSHSNCLHIQALLVCIKSSDIQLSNYPIIWYPIIWYPFSFDHHLSLLCYLLSFLILALNYYLKKILIWYQSYTKFLHVIRAIGFSLHSH